MTIAVGTSVAAVAGVPTASLVGAATGATVTCLGKAALGSSFNAAGVVASSASAAAIFASAATKSAIGGAVGGAVATISSGASALAYSVLGGPLGTVIVGTEQDQQDSQQVSSNWTFDCWKAVLRDTSADPSQGMALRELVVDERVKTVEIDAAPEENQLPVISVTNVWNETFQIQWLEIEAGMLSAHAVLMRV